MSKLQILRVVLFQHLHFLALESNVLDNRVLRLMGSAILSLETIAIFIRGEALGIDGILNIVRIGVVSKGNIFLIIITQITIERFAWHKKNNYFSKAFRSLPYRSCVVDLSCSMIAVLLSIRVPTNTHIWITLPPCFCLI
jgi:hypothetical protein